MEPSIVPFLFFLFFFLSFPRAFAHTEFSSAARFVVTVRAPRVARFDGAAIRFFSFFLFFFFFSFPRKISARSQRTGSATVGKRPTNWLDGDRGPGKRTIEQPRAGGQIEKRFLFSFDVRGIFATNCRGQMFH